MFSKIRNFIDELEFKVTDILKETINDFDYIIINMITEDQLFEKGIDGTGEKIKNQQTGSLGYTRFTIRVKISKSQPIDRITLKDTGSFYNSIRVEGTNNSLIVSSNIGITADIIEKYGIDVLRPTKETMEEFIKEYYLPKLKEYADSKKSR